MGCCCAYDAEGEQYLDETHQKKMQRINYTPDLVPLNSQDLRASHVESVQKDGERFKILGNENFKNKNYTQAIKYYQQAISTNTIDITYYSNLALAYKANCQYKQSVDTINQMIRNPNFNDIKSLSLLAKGKLIKARSIMLIVKNYCFQGKYSQKSNYEHLTLMNESITMMEKMAIDQKIPLENQQYLQTAFKLKQFLINQVIPKSKSQDIIDYLNIKFQKRGYAFEQNQQQLAKYFNNKQQIIEQLASIAENLKATAVEEQKQYLIDPITYEYLTQAVIVPSGTTYNQQTLKQHFKNNGYNDPITHQIFQIGQKVVVRNNSLHKFAAQQKKAVSKDDLQYLKY